MANKKSSTQIRNSIYLKMNKEEIPDELWQELFDSCKTFIHFREARYCAWRVNEKWESIFLNGMKKTADERNPDQLRAIVQLMNEKAGHWKYYVDKLIKATKKRGTLYAWNECLSALPEDSVAFAEAKKYRDKLKKKKKQ